MKANPTVDNIMKFVEAAREHKGILTEAHYDLAILYLKKCNNS
jgi:hypothetical protein